MNDERNRGGRYIAAEDLAESTDTRERSPCSKSRRVEDGCDVLTCYALAASGRRRPRKEGSTPGRMTGQAIPTRRALSFIYHDDPFRERQ